MARGVTEPNLVLPVTGHPAFFKAARYLGVDVRRTPAAKVVAALYALYSGIVFLLAASVLLAPALHRMLHRLHVQD